MRLFKDYDLIILHHLRKVNVMADALSCKSVENLAIMITIQAQLLEEMRQLYLNVVALKILTKLIALMLQPTLLGKIKKQAQDSSL